MFWSTSHKACNDTILSQCVMIHESQYSTCVVLIELQSGVHWFGHCMRFPWEMYMHCVIWDMYFTGILESNIYLVLSVGKNFILSN